VSDKVFCLQEIAQLIGITPNKVEVTSSNLTLPLMWTYKNKNKKSNKVFSVIDNVFNFPFLRKTFTC
jgi:hypothetical protein